MGVYERFNSVEMIGYHERKESNNTFYHFIYKSDQRIGLNHLLINRHNETLFILKSTNEIFKNFEEQIDIDKKTIFDLFDDIHNTTGFLCYHNNRFIVHYPHLVEDGVNGLIVKEQAYFEIS